MGNVEDLGVVKLCEVTSEIILVKMEDRKNKNTFSKALVSQLIEAFQTINCNEKYKVAILTGYDNYFATGGTKESLIAINKNREKFTDTNIYSLALECKIPVISAMQGHGIGGGFIMGLFSDFVVLGKECIYTTNFMRYGFTPGMGATLIVPYKLGYSLGEEMLMNAQNYRGQQLAQRGVPFPVIPKNDVITYSIETAKELCEKPRFSLITLKKHLTENIREQLPVYIQKELYMHELTFHQEEVGKRIENLFGR